MQGCESDSGLLKPTVTCGLLVVLPTYFRYRMARTMPGITGPTPATSSGQPEVVSDPQQNGCDLDRPIGWEPGPVRGAQNRCNRERSWRPADSMGLCEYRTLLHTSEPSVEGFSGTT